MKRFFHTFLTAFLVIAPVSAAGADTVYSEIVVFGDSLSDTGNLFVDSGGVVTAPPYFSGRFSNGPVWVEVLAGQLGLTAPAPSLAGGTNYAFGGAETGPGLSSVDTPNVGRQIDSFVADRGAFVGDELIVVAAGSNDLLSAPPFGPGHVAEELRKHIADLAAIGGKTFLVANSPVATSRVVGLDENSKGAKLNQLLDKELDKVQTASGVTIHLFDMAAVQADILLNPGDFGLTNLIDPACPGCNIGIPDPDAFDTLVLNQANLERHFSECA